MPEKHIISNKLVSLSDRVIVEPYLALTPLNRYPKSFFVTHCDQPYKFLDDHLHRPSIFSLDTCQYLNELLSYVHSYSSELYSLLSRYLDSKSASLSQSIDLSYSHGDFQASNILLNDSGNFLISDWEDFAYRSTTYDFFIYYSGIRQSSVKPTIWFNFLSL